MTTKMKTYCRLLLVLVMMASAGIVRAQINTEQVVNIGRNALYFEDYVLAIQYFNQAIKAKPFLAEPYFYRSVAKISLEDYRGAEQDAGMAIERNPFIVDAYQVRGVSRQNLNDFQGAIDDYVAGLNLMPEDKNLLFNLAVCQSTLKKFDEAKSTFDRLLGLDRRNDRAFFGLAQMNLACKDTTAALENLNRSITLNKNNANAYVMRAEIASRSQHDFSSAIADMDSAILLEPRFAGYFINRAYMKYNVDDYFGAMADYDYAISLDPASQEAHFNRGLLRAEVGDNNKAIIDFDYVLKSNPSNFIALFNRALLYMRTRQYREAVADFTAILKKYPEFEAGYMARGEAKRRMGDNRGGDADYEKAMAIFRRNKTHESTFNPVEIEATAAIKKAEQRAISGEDEPETADEIMNRFNMLLTVNDNDAFKPEYTNRQRGHVQNDNKEVEPMPMFTLTYYDKDDKLNGKTHYIREIGDINDSRLLPAKLTIINGESQLNEEEIQRQFLDIDYYNSLMANSKPRGIDHFARGLDYLLVKNPDAALADADAAIALSPQFMLAYLLRADARYMQYRMGSTRNGQGADDKKPDSADDKAQIMLRQRQDAMALSQIMSDLDEAIKLSPKNMYAYYNKGNVYMMQGDYTSAISCFSTAIELMPDFAEAYYNRGLMYLRLGNKNLGISDLSKAGELGVLPSYNVIKRMGR